MIKIARAIEVKDRATVYVIHRGIVREGMVIDIGPDSSCIRLFGGEDVEWATYKLANIFERRGDVELILEGENVMSRRTELLNAEEAFKARVLRERGGDPEAFLSEIMNGVYDDESC